MIGKDDLFTEVTKLVTYIKSLQSQGKFNCRPKGASSRHCGAIITDAVLQMGHNYEKQVRDRVNNVKTMPTAASVSGFLNMLQAQGVKQVLDWKAGKTTNLVIRHTQFFLEQGLDTYTQFENWLMQETNRDSMIKLNLGMRQRTADYYGVLVLDPDAVKVDSRINAFLKEAKIIDSYGYKDKREIVRQAARQLGCRPLDLDNSIWIYMG